MNNNFSKLNLKFRGGARIGLSNITYPFASLNFDEYSLIINASILGQYVFLQQNIIRLEKYNGFFSNGIKVVHNIKTYPKNIVFWSLKGVDNILDEYNQYKFENNNINRLEEITTLQKGGGFPLSKKIFFTLLIGYILSILFDFSVLLTKFGVLPNVINTQNYYIFTLSVVFSCLFVTYLGIILFFPRIRNIFIKKGHQLKNFKMSLYLLFIYFISFLYIFQLFHKFFR